MHKNSFKIVSYVYALHYIGRKKFFYVGVTNNMERRLKEHRKERGCEDIEIKLLKKCRGYLQRLQQERIWCIKLRNQGHPVQNYFTKMPDSKNIYA